MFLEARRRGWLRPGRMRVRSYYPLGLVRVWSWVDLDVACLVYPRPASVGPLPLDSGHGDDGHATPDPGAEDFSGFRDYRPGDPLRRVAWKTLAKGQRLQTREYLAFADRRRWLAWEQTEGCGGVEERLSLLCRWVLELHRLKAEFGLLLPGLRLEPASGEAHRDRALAALALHGIDSGMSVQLPRRALLWVLGALVVAIMPHAARDCRCGYCWRWRSRSAGVIASTRGVGRFRRDW